jgi:hypothetical protein
VTASEWIKSYVEHHAGIEPTPEEIWNAARAELREPGPCGKHPKVCWVEGRGTSAQRRASPFGSNPEPSYCAVCAELAERAKFAEKSMTEMTIAIRKAANLERLRAVRDEAKESYEAYCHWFESDSSLAQLEHLFEGRLAAHERAVKEAEGHG